jgi:hypothetical protein
MMAEVTTFEHGDGSVTTVVTEGDRTFQSTVTPQEAAALALQLTGSRVGFAVGAVAAVKRMRDYKTPPESSWDVLDAATKKKYGTPDRWWQAIGKDARVSSRASFAALKAERPNDTAKQASAWWGSIGKNSRQRLRAKYTRGYDDDFMSELASVANTVVDVATLKPIAKHIPIAKDIQSSIASVYKAPMSAVTSIAKGERLDRVAMQQFQTQLKAAKTLGPYVQTVVSVVPGLGSGLSAAIGGALALASGASIDAALLAAARSALPGGPLAQAAFDVALAAAQGKPVEAVLINALPVAPAAKDALIRGARAARQLAEGKSIDKVLVDQALDLLPPQARAAAQVGVALAQGQAIQKVAGAAAKLPGFSPATVRAASVSKALAGAAKGLAASSPASSMKLAATSKLNLAGVASSLGARRSAQQLIASAQKATSPAVLAQANAARKALAASSPSSQSILEAARRGRVRSSSGGAVTPAQLAAAQSAGRVFYVQG